VEHDDQGNGRLTDLRFHHGGNFWLAVAAITASSSLAAEYSEKAAQYHEHWTPVIRPMARPIFGALPLGAAQTVLDVGAGTGAMLEDIRQTATRASLIGLDRAEGMLRIAKLGGWNSVAVADGQKLCIRSDTIDVGLLIFTLFHIPDPVQALREVTRVLRSDGVIGIVCWGNDPGAPGAAIWTEELNREGAAPDPRHASVVQVGAMNTKEKLTQLIEASGLTAAKIWSETFCHSFKLEDLLAVQLGVGTAARRLPSLGAEARRRCKQRVVERLEMFSDSQLEYRPEVLFAVAGNR
jgi:ubiquinone/menaquinone biosynthesis C-methylase UbiE